MNPRKFNICLSIIGLLLFSNTSFAQKKTSEKDKKDKVAWLMTLNAEKGKIVACKSDPKKKCLRVDGISEHMIIFSDRPNRLYRKLKTKEILGKWKNAFKESSPNVAMVHKENNDLEENDANVLDFKKIVSHNKNSAVFEIEILDKDHNLSNGTVLENVSLFIDGVLCCDFNLSFCCCQPGQNCG